MNISYLFNILLLFYLDIVTENRIGQFDSPILIGKYINTNNYLFKFVIYCMKPFDVR